MKKVRVTTPMAPRLDPDKVAEALGAEPYPCGHYHLEYGLCSLRMGHREREHENDRGVWHTGEGRR